jgi:coenzyme F420-reducing hydrogenase delta subunit
VAYVHKLLNEIGLDGERVQMTNLSAAMGAQFAQTANEIAQRINALGPNPLREPIAGGEK